MEAVKALKLLWWLALVGVSPLTLSCGAIIVRVIRVEIWEVFLNNAGTVRTTATKLACR